MDVFAVHHSYLLFVGICLVSATVKDAVTAVVEAELLTG
jgi:hypothetical protein